MFDLPFFLVCFFQSEDVRKCSLLNLGNDYDLGLEFINLDLYTLLFSEVVLVSTYVVCEILSVM